MTGRVQLSIVAVGLSSSRAEAGDAVLGSPSCAVPDEEGDEDEDKGNCDDGHTVRTAPRIQEDDDNDHDRNWSYLRIRGR